MLAYIFALDVNYAEDVLAPDPHIADTGLQGGRGGR